MSAGPPARCRRCGAPLHVAGGFCTTCGFEPPQEPGGQRWRNRLLLALAVAVWALIAVLLGRSAGAVGGEPAGAAQARTQEHHEAGLRPTR